MFLPSPVSTFPSVGRVLGHCIQSFLYKMADVSKEDRQYLEAIQARMKQQAAQRAAKEASLRNANEHAQSGLSATALGKRPAALGNNPVETFSLEQYNELAHQVTKLKSEHGVKELEWQRKLIELRETHEEEMKDAVANAVTSALTAQSVKRGETTDIIAEVMTSIDNILKTKGAGSQKLARGLVRGLNPNLVTRHTMRKVPYV